jgi:proline iminopeptidase
MEKRMIHNILETDINLYTSTLTPEGHFDAYVLFVHGGPGSHCAWFEAAIQQLSSYNLSNVGWIAYDQKGCGRSSDCGSNITHQQNIDDLVALCNKLPNLLDKPLKAVYGHSYGARLAYDTFKTHPDIDLKLLLAGRGVYGVDSMNLSTLMDLYILRESDPQKFRQAFDLVAKHEGLASDKFSEIRPLLDAQHRQKERNKFYWGNQDTLKWYQEIKKTVSYKDNNDVFESVRHTYDNFESIYIPSNLKQDTLMIKGFWDFLMTGATHQGVGEQTVTFNGSGHYPHFEEPRKFLSTLENFINSK